MKMKKELLFKLLFSYARAYAQGILKEKKIDVIYIYYNFINKRAFLIVNDVESIEIKNIDFDKFLKNLPEFNMENLKNMLIFEDKTVKLIYWDKNNNKLSEKIIEL